MKLSNAIALGMILLLVLWIGSGKIISGKPDDKPQAAEQAGRVPMKVQVKTFTAESVTSELLLQGQLEPWRTAVLRAETAGTVEKVDVEHGTRVTAGQELVRLAMDDRKIRLARAEAQLSRSKADLEAAERLLKKQLQSENNVRAAKASLAVAEAELAAVQLDIARTSIRAPFDGFIEHRAVEVGVLLERGDDVATIVDDSRIRASAQVPQQHVASLSPGQPVSVRLITGEQAEGKLTFISRVADAGTRSYRIEAEVPNPDHELISGLSAVLEIPTGKEVGHFFKPSLLTLHDDGRLGVMAVNEKDEAVFYPVELIRSEGDGVWVSGLPAKVRLVTFGQGFIQAGEIVDAVEQQQGQS